MKKLFTVKCRRYGRTKHPVTWKLYRRGVQIDKGGAYSEAQAREEAFKAAKHWLSRQASQDRRDWESADEKEFFVKESTSRLRVPLPLPLTVFGVDAP